MNEASSSLPGGTGAARPRRATQRLAPLARRIEKHGRYTRFVGAMRWLLALGAVALGLSLVLWPYLNAPDSGDEILLGETTGIELKDGRPTMVNARFLATDDQGQPYTITADIAWQEQGVEEIVFMETLTGDILLKSGAWLALSADRGVFDQVEELLILESQVDLFSDLGYELHTDYAEVDLRAGTAEGDRPVAGQGPAGLLDAGGFRIADNGDRILFTGGVHMTVYPGDQP